MKVKILLDHVSRELNFAVKLKKYFELKNLGTVAIQHQDFINSVDHYDFFDVCFDDKYDILIVPSYNVKRSPEMLFRAWVSKSKLVIYHSEQLFNEQFDEEKLNLSSLSKYNKHVSAHLVWGEEFATKLVNKASVDPNKIFIVGNYKFDFLSDIKHSASNKILLASDFKLGDLTNEEFSNFEKKYNVRLPKNYNEKCRNARETAMEWLLKFADMFPNLDFFLRPHPGEARESYIDLSEKRKNIYVSNPLISYSDDLRDSALVLGFTSTSVMEVITAGKVMLSMKVEDISTDFLSSHKDLLIWKSFDEVAHYLAQVSDGKRIFPSEEMCANLNKIVSKQKNVCSNVVSACININESPNMEMKLHLSDYRSFLKIFMIGSLKFAFLKVSNCFPNSFLFKDIILRSKSSFSKRCNEGENLTSKLINEEFDKIRDPLDLSSQKMIKTTYGNVFDSN